MCVRVLTQSDPVASGAAACQAPLSMGFSGQERWGGWPCPPPGGLPDPGSHLRLLCLLQWRAGSLALEPPGKPSRSLGNRVGGPRYLPGAGCDPRTVSGSGCRAGRSCAVEEAGPQSSVVSLLADGGPGVRLLSLCLLVSQ